MNPTPQQPEPSALIRDHVEDPKNNGDYRLDISGQPLTDLWRACERVEGELRATKAELASERAAGADWKNIATQAADKLHAMVLERDRLNAALQDIERNCSLNGFPEDAPEQVAFIAGLVKEALAAPTQAGKVGP